VIYRSRGDHLRPAELAEAELADKVAKADAKGRACVSAGCSGCGGYGCPYAPPPTLEEARKVESLGGSPSCLTWPPRPPIIDGEAFTNGGQQCARPEGSK